MARNENPPFPRGGLGTAYSDPGTVDTTGYTHLEGKEWLFEDQNPVIVDGVASGRTNQYVTCRVVRNVSGGALLPKRMAMYKTDGTGAGDYGGRVSGYATVGKAGGVVDEYLPAAGVPSNELFWLVTQGPTTVTTDTAGDTNISVGSYVQAGGTGDGTIVDATAATDGPTAQSLVNSQVGRAMAAVNATATDVLVNIRRMDA